MKTEKEVEHLNKALALKLDALPSGLSAGQSMKLENELAELRRQNAALVEALKAWRYFEKRHAAIVLGELNADRESAERESNRYLHELRIVADKALAAKPEGTD